MKERSTFPFGWVIVGFSFVTLALVYGVWYSFSVFFVALLKEFSWSRSVVAGAFSLFVILHSLIGPFVGGVVDRLGPKKVILLGSLCLGIGLFLCSFIQNWWQFYLFFGILTGLGVGSTGWVPHTTIIQQWFKEKRGLATGIISSGIGIGILVCVPTFQLLITRTGWRITYRLIAIIIPLIITFMVMMVLKRQPQKAAPSPLTMESPHIIEKNPFIINEEWTSQHWTARRAATTKPFWLLGFSFFLGNFITQSIFAHQVAFFVDYGQDALFSSYIVGMVGIVSIVGKILWAALSDKIGREMTYTIGMTCFVFGMILLILFGLFPFPGLTYFYVLFFGMGYAVAAALPPLITSDFFEGQAFGSIFGSLMIFVGVGGAFGAWFAGFLYDLKGSYLPVFVLIIVCSIFACLNIWRAAPRKIKSYRGKGGRCLFHRIFSDGT